MCNIRGGINFPLLSFESNLTVNESLNFILLNNLKIGNTVLISINNSEQLKFPDEFWLKIFNILSQINLNICIIDKNSLSIKLLNTVVIYPNIKFIDLPFHLTITLTSLLGYYIGNSTDFISIQSKFQKKSKGINFINYINIISDNDFEYNNNYKINDNEYFSSKDNSNLTILSITDYLDNKILKSNINNALLSKLLT